MRLASNGELVSTIRMTDRPAGRRRVTEIMYKANPPDMCLERGSALRYLA